MSAVLQNLLQRWEVDDDTLKNVQDRVKIDILSRGIPERLIDTSSIDREVEDAFNAIDTTGIRQAIDGFPIEDPEDGGELDILIENVMEEHIIRFQQRMGEFDLYHFEDTYEHLVISHLLYMASRVENNQLNT